MSKRKNRKRPGPIARQWFDKCRAMTRNDWCFGVRASRGFWNCVKSIWR